MRQTGERVVTRALERRAGGIRFGWVAIGWFVAAAVAGTVLFALIAVGAIPRDARNAGFGSLFAVAVGFAAGGFTTARRASDRPLAHGLAIGAFSLLVWIVANLLARAVTGTPTWDALPFGQTVALLVIQAVAAALGAWVGHARDRAG